MPEKTLKLTYGNLEFPNFPGVNPRTPYNKGRGRGRKGGGERGGGGRGVVGGGEWGKGGERREGVEVGLG